MFQPRWIGALCLCGALAAPLASQIKTFQPGEAAKASEVNQNFSVVKGLADNAKSAADTAKSAADAAKSTADGAQAAADQAKVLADQAARDALAAKNLADGLKNRTDLTGANIVDNSLELVDIKPDILSAINGVRNDGGSISIVGTNGITVSSSNTSKRITLSNNYRWTGGSIRTATLPAIQLDSTNMNDYTNGLINVGTPGVGIAVRNGQTGSRFSTGITVQSRAYGIYGTRGLLINAQGGDNPSNSQTILGAQIEAGSRNQNRAATGLKARAQSNFGSAIGLEGAALGMRTGAVGVNGVAQDESSSATTRGVRGEAVSRNIGVGVYGQSNGSRYSYGVHGKAADTTTSFRRYGVHGETVISTGYGVYATGRIGSTVNKQFIHPHPKNPAKVVTFVCLEGNESGTYFRGKAWVRAGTATIKIPTEWQHVTSKQGITVQLTPIRSLAKIAVWEMTRDKITVRADEDCEFSYMVNGVRRGFEQHEATRQNTDFRPEFFGLPFGQLYPKAYRDLLVENGILNPDYTPNVLTAKRLGWELKQPTTKDREAALAAEATWRAQYIKPAATFGR